MAAGRPMSETHIFDAILINQRMLAMYRKKDRK